MKKISSSFLKSLNWLLTSVLMLLGFSTCDSEPGAAMSITDIGLTRYQLFPQILLESFIASLKNFQPTNYGS